nr:succinate dehydrogenase/fumarate reductase iron-sulfur subunit [Prolixibacteraceae bacterium]
MADKILNKLYIKVWRQNSPKEKGGFETYEIEDISQGSSFLEMLDILNDKLIRDGKDPIAFDHD